MLLLEKKASIIRGVINGEKELSHLKVLVRGKAIVVYSEFQGEKENRCRFINLKGDIFQLSMADRNGRWQSTPYQGTIEELWEMTLQDFGWVLEGFDDFDSYSF